jgi:hypothetical protein
MKVRILFSTAPEFPCGEVLDLPADVAKALIASGDAEPASPAKVSKAEAAEAAAAEAAAAEAAAAEAAAV